MAQRQKGKPRSAAAVQDDAQRDADATMDAAQMAALQRELDALSPEEHQQLAAMLEAKYGGGRTH